MLIKLLRLLWKGPLTAFIILIFFLFGIINKIIFFPSVKIRKTLAQRNTQWAALICRYIIGYRGTYKIKSNPMGHLLICNHMSYMDVLVIASKVPTLFVTSLEMKNTPFLGWITQLGECLYVNRRSHKNLNHEIQTIQNWINQGFNVLIFPEATTGNGTKIKAFKSSLLQISQNGNIPITAYCLKYLRLNSKKTNAKDMLENICWYENAAFIPHLFKQFMNKKVQFELIEVDHFQSNLYTERKSLVSRLESSIGTEYGNIDSI
jgi:1-acyl-sn-glycerol-3-phosphate acyltransferase